MSYYFCKHGREPPEDPDYETPMRPLLKPGGKYVSINGGKMDWTRGLLEEFVFMPLFGLSIQRPDFDLFIVRPAPLPSLLCLSVLCSVSHGFRQVC